MPLIKQYRYFRSDLRENPNVIYVFGDNEVQKGLGGQAAEARGEPNAFGIPTKKQPRTTPESYWSEEDHERQIGIVNEHFGRLEMLLEQGRIVVWPTDGIGTGLSELPERAPGTQKVIDEWISRLFQKYGA